MLPERLDATALVCLTDVEYRRSRDKEGRVLPLALDPTRMRILAVFHGSYVLRHDAINAFKKRHEARLAVLTQPERVLEWYEFLIPLYNMPPGLEEKKP
jgi:hypothetical protein